MKNATLFLLIIFSCFSIQGQDIAGTWHGSIAVQGIQLRLVFNIIKTDKGYSSTMDSPDQGAKDIPVTSTTFENSILRFEIKNAGIDYTGEFIEKRFVGTFKQAGHSFPLDLLREIIEKKISTKPQEPIKPYPYYSEEVSFENIIDKITLAGTLTLPEKEGEFPVVVLISGSGPQNRDEELLGHKPFLVLSDHLTRNGIAVLRFDDRGTSESKGDFKTATSLDFAKDVESAIIYLKTRKEINKNRMGLIGHSEGGIIAPMVAERSKDISFIVLLAGTGIPGDQLLLLQQKLIGEAYGENNEELQKSLEINKGAFDLVVKSSNIATLKSELETYIKQALKDIPESERPENISEEDFVKIQVEQLTNPWMHYFLRYNPAIILEKVKCPVLAINGEKDLQVPAKINLESIKKALEKGGNKNVKAIEIPNLNHLFQECKTGSPEEYAEIEQTFSPKALMEIANWIIQQSDQ